jgi:protein TonB
MDSEMIMQSDVLDILFEKRNKLYGAYILRKFYNHRLIKSVSITIGAATVLCAFTLVSKTEATFMSVGEISLAPFSEPKAPMEKKEVPKKMPAKGSQKTQTSLIIITDSTNTTDTQHLLKESNYISIINISDREGELPGTTIGGIAVGKGSGEIQKPAEIVIDASQPTEHPEIEPTYPGGINALREFLERNLINPTEMSAGEMVTVHVRFVVGYDGKLQKFAVVKDGGDIFNNEVIRVLKKMPEWEPGKSNGQNVAAYFTIPVKFVPAD